MRFTSVLFHIFSSKQDPEIQTILNTITNYVSS